MFGHLIGVLKRLERVVRDVYGLPLYDLWGAFFGVGKKLVEVHAGTLYLYRSACGVYDGLSAVLGKVDGAGGVDKSVAIPRDIR